MVFYDREEKYQSNKKNRNKLYQHSWGHNFIVQQKILSVDNKMILNQLLNCKYNHIQLVLTRICY